MKYHIYTVPYMEKIITTYGKDNPFFTALQCHFCHKIKWQYICRYVWGSLLCSFGLYVYCCANTITWKRSKSVSLSRVQPFVTAWIVARQAPLSMEFSRREYWNGLPCLPPGHLPNPGIEPGSPTLQANSLLSEPPRKPNYLLHGLITVVFM